MKKCILFNLLICLTLAGISQVEYLKRNFIRDNDTLRYRILYPEHYKSSDKYPLLVFLHGAGERGNDNNLQLVHGSKLFLDSANRKNFPAIVVFPQCPENDFWSGIEQKTGPDGKPAGLYFPIDVKPGKAMSLVMQFLDSMVTDKAVDPDRIYVGGLSMGGMGTFEILWRKPGFFAAAFPICGGGNTEKAKTYGKDFPIWVFHGADDAVVPVSLSQKMVQALKEAGAKVKYSEYPGVNHNSWDNAFAEKDLLPWMFSHKRKK